MAKQSKLGISLSDRWDPLGKHGEIAENMSLETKLENP